MPYWQKYINTYHAGRPIIMTTTVCGNESFSLEDMPESTKVKNH